MSKMRGRHRQRAVMASDAEWVRIGQRAKAAGMERSRYVVGRALGDEGLGFAVRHRALRQSLVLAVLEERRLREAGAGRVWDEACAAVDAWLEREGALERLTDPGAANRWQAVVDAAPGEDDGAP